ncbi:hypothetical protein [Candidatus Odyssella thessalonicensis]|uniref:hypothetical protein n=1 Tax=Candidatus Odyssella thessalonicensis TaxID=84647 RepID=UPI000225B4AB|nr:hypothetical protein [Candidatus Odyssella thessalonicensis]
MKIKGLQQLLLICAMTAFTFPLHAMDVQERGTPPSSPTLTETDVTLISKKKKVMKKLSRQKSKKTGLKTLMITSPVTENQAGFTALSMIHKR